MPIIDKFCRTDFKSYKEFKKDFKIDVPQDFNFAFDIMDELAQQKPDERALVWCNDKGEERTFTFLELMQESNRAANLFVSSGIKKGDFIMLTLKRHYEYWISALALHKIGAVIIPATHMLTVKDFIYRFTAANVSGIITTGENDILGIIDEAESGLPQPLKQKIVVRGEKEGYINYKEEIAKQSTIFERPTGEEATTAQDNFLLYFTSGTTGYPKMVIHNYAYPLGHILTAKFWHNLSPGDLHLSVADTGWAKCSWGKIYGQWICEAAIFVYDYDNKFKPIDLIKVVSKYSVNVFCAPPTIFRFLIQDDLASYDLSALKYCCTAGEPLNPEVFKKWKKMTGLEIKEGFGQTETCVVLATFPFISPKAGSTGRPCPHFNAKIINEHNEECDYGVVGEICLPIKDGLPAGLTLGYYKDEEKTAQAFKDGYYHTGDMAWQDEEGYIFFEGRGDDVIKSSGYRIGPFEVESALLEHDAVLEAAITAVPDPVRGQVVKATVVLTKNKGYVPSQELVKELQNHVKKVTAPYKYPRIIEFVDELPKTISGKIKRVDIRNKDKE